MSTTVDRTDDRTDDGAAPLPSPDEAGTKSIRLVPNRSCDSEGHFLCWRIDCRHCATCLAPHVDVGDVRAATIRLARAHACP